MQTPICGSSGHQIVEKRRYVPTGGGTKDSDVFDGYYCTRCGADGWTPEEINQQPCQPRQGKKGGVPFSALEPSGPRTK